METSTTLPADAIAALQAAFSTPITGNNPLARRRAIDAAIESVKRKYPQFFKEQQDETK